MSVGRCTLKRTTSGFKYDQKDSRSGTRDCDMVKGKTLLIISCGGLNQFLIKEWLIDGKKDLG